MLVDILFVVAVIVILIAIYKTKFAQKKSVQELKAQLLLEGSTKKNKEAHDDNKGKGVDSSSPLLREQKNVERKQQQWMGDDEQQQNELQSDQQKQSLSSSLTDHRKQLYKQQKRQQKQQRKQAQQQFLQQQKRNRQQYQKQQQKQQLEQQQKRRKQQQYIEQMRQQQRLRKQQQFNKWKDMFQVEQSGISKQSQDELKRKELQLEEQLINYLINKKLTLLEDASHIFGIKTNQLVQKIKKLELDGKISGVFDQRGKYLVINDHEWNAVKNYITVKGRLKKSEMMTECAKIIKIPQEGDEDLLKLITSQVQPTN